MVFGKGRLWRNDRYTMTITILSTSLGALDERIQLLRLPLPQLDLLMLMFFLGGSFQPGWHETCGTLVARMARSNLQTGPQQT
jgi:hypothetical protein